MPRRPALALLVGLAVALSTLATAPAAVAGDRDCGDFSSQRSAQIFYLSQGGPQSDPHYLDSDNDGIACESNPAPYYYGTTLPGGGGSEPEPEPEPQIVAVRSSVQLSLAPSTRIAGESYRMTVSVRPAISRAIEVQRKVGGQWRRVLTATTTGGGRWSGPFAAPRADVTYRALVQPATRGHKKYSAATSRTRTLDVQPQRVVLAFDDRRVDEGEQVRALVRATPVRAGRTVVLQMRSEGAWRTVRTSRFDRRGRASFTITPALGEDAYRAVALRHRGAAPAQSTTRTVTAVDVTPPPAPFDLVATPGDGSVLLTWDRVLPSDFAHHEVWMRTADTDEWTLVLETEADTVAIDLLRNGVEHWFTVASVDTSGNVSELADEVAATPTAPVEQARVGRVRPAGS